MVEFQPLDQSAVLVLGVGRRGSSCGGSLAGVVGRGLWRSHGRGVGVRLRWPNAARSCGSSIEEAVLSPLLDLVADAADAPRDDRSSFHIASATVSPKPSARLFWTTTAAWRWRAFTIAAASSASAIGMHARCTRPRCMGEISPKSTHSSSTSAASGSSATPVTAGPPAGGERRGRDRRARRSRSSHRACPSCGPSARPARPAGASAGGGGPVWSTSTRLLMRPVRAVAAGKGGGGQFLRHLRSGRCRPSDPADVLAGRSARSWRRTGRSTEGSRALSGLVGPGGAKRPA